MNVINQGMEKIDKIKSIKKGFPDDIFITCVSFERRCLGVLQKLDEYSSNNVLVFKFDEENPIREENLIEMETILTAAGLREKYQKIHVRHGMTTDGILQLHNYCKNNNLLTSSSHTKTVTLDITTFTKELLFEILFYLTNILKIEKLRFLYTVPEKYASPDEGPLSHGIKSIKVIPFFWNKWSVTKDDFLMVILGYEEMRAWSLISRFDANINKLFITKPGSKPEWDTHCESYNERLLKENYDIDKIPAMDPIAAIKSLENQIIQRKLYDKYNIFIAPLGTKPQIVGIFYFINKHPETNTNIISTTAIEHNTPYYSWGIGDTYYIFSEDIINH